MAWFTFTVIRLRDLGRYADPEETPADPMKIIEERKAKIGAR